MLIPFALLDVHSLLVAQGALMPVAGGAFTGLAVALFRMPASRVSDAESVMNFSSLGTLRCICGAEHKGMAADRRGFCRSCGCEVLTTDPAQFQKQLSRREIRRITKNLRQAAIRAAHLELPANITNVEELHRYLASSDERDQRTTPTQPTAVEQPQVH